MLTVALFLTFLALFANLRVVND